MWAVCGLKGFPYWGSPMGILLQGFFYRAPRECLLIHVLLVWTLVWAGDVGPYRDHPIGCGLLACDVEVKALRSSSM